MTKQSAIKKLEKNGYSVTFTFSGKVIAKKGQQSYSADSINALISLLF